jgi:hypothetical protein
MDPDYISLNPYRFPSAVSSIPKTEAAGSYETLKPICFIVSRPVYRNFLSEICINTGRMLLMKAQAYPLY